MTDFLIRPAGASDWSGAIAFSGTLPISNQDAGALGLALDTDYEIAVVGSSQAATFQVTDVSGAVPDIYAAPNFDQITASSVRVLFGTTPNDNGAPITRRDLRYSSTGGSTWTVLQDVTPPHSLTGLSANTGYLVQTRAVNSNGAAPWSPSGSTTTQSSASAPGQMAAPSLVANGSTALTATLAGDPAANGSPITGYTLRYSTDQSSWTTQTGISSPHQITGLAADTLYYVQTRAVNAIGAGAWSSSAQQSTEAAAAAAPEINTLSVGAQDSDGDIVLSGSFTQTGTLHYVFSDSANAPSIAQIAAGQDHSGSAAAQSGSFVISGTGSFTDPDLPTGLSGTHYAYAYLSNSNGSSAVSSTAGFALDTIVPSLSAAGGSATGATTANGSVTSSKAGGTLYGGLTAAGGNAPSAAQLIAQSGGSLVATGTDSSPSVGSGNTVAFTGLSASTSYVPYFVQVSATGQQSGVIAGGQFQTSAGGSNDIAPFVDSAKLAPGDGASGSYTTPSLTLGTGDVLIGVVWMSGGGSNQRLLSSLSANGASCSRIVRSKNSQFVLNAEWFEVNNPGASGPVVAQFTNNGGTPSNLNSDGGVMIVVFAGGNLSVVDSAGEDASSVAAGTGIAVDVDTTSGGKVLALYAHYGSSGGAGLIDLTAGLTEVDRELVDTGKEIACLALADVNAASPRAVTIGSNTQNSFFGGAAAISVETA